MRYTAYTDDGAGALGIRVISCGHIFAEEGRAIDRPSGREDHLLFYIAKGQVRFTLAEEVTADAGSFILYAPHEPQRHVCISPKAEFYYIHFTAKTLPTTLSTSAVYVTEPGEAVPEMVEGLIDEVQQKQPCYERLIVWRFLELLTLLERRVIGSSTRSAAHGDKIARVTLSMHKEPEMAYTLDDYAAMCSLSRYHFLRVFKSITGTSPMEYRNSIRMARAKELLTDTELSVSEVGSRVGFASAACFCDAFKRKAGMSPSEFRKRNRWGSRY